MHPGAQDPIAGRAPVDRARDRRVAAVVLVAGVVGVVIASLAARVGFADDALDASSAAGARRSVAVDGGDGGDGADGSDAGADGADLRASARWGTRQEPLPLGSEVDLGNGWRVRVVGATRGPAADQQVAAADEFNEPAPRGRSYVVVSLSATFAGRADAASESPFDGVDVFLVGAGEGPGELPADEIEPPAPALDQQADVAAGVTVSGNVVLVARVDERAPVLRVAAAGRSEAAWVALP